MSYQQIPEFIAAIRELHRQGWAPATSSNYSLRGTHPGEVIISRSGVDKAVFDTQHLMTVDYAGRALNPPDWRPSAETLLHTMLYARADQAGLPETLGCVLHTHSVANTVLSQRYAGSDGQLGHLTLAGLELLKALPGITTHEATVQIPIFPNTQDILALSQQVATYADLHSDFCCYLIAGHGLYAWGPTVYEAKRAIEALEVLFQVRLWQDALPKL